MADDEQVKQYHLIMLPKYRLELLFTHSILNVFHPLKTIVANHNSRKGAAGSHKIKFR